MGKPKLEIIVLFQNLGDQESYFARSPAPPLSGALVAGLTGYVEAVLGYLAVGTHVHAGLRMYRIRSEAAEGSGSLR